MKSDSIQNNQINKHFLSSKELATYFNVSKKSVYRRIENRDLPFYKIGSCIRFKKEDVDNYLTKVLVESISK
jgi:excisionase family DNA binding protein